MNIDDEIKAIAGIVKNRLENEKRSDELTIEKLTKQINKLHCNPKFTIVCNGCGKSDVNIKYDVSNNNSYLLCENCGRSKYI